MTCMECGTALKPGDKFCASCGAPVPDSSANDTVQMVKPRGSSGSKSSVGRAPSPKTAAAGSGKKPATSTPEPTPRSEGAGTSKPQIQAIQIGADGKPIVAAPEPEPAAAVSTETGAVPSTTSSTPAAPRPAGAPWTTTRKVVVGAVALVAVLLVAGVAVGIGAAIGSANSNVNNVSSGDNTDSGVDTVDETDGSGDTPTDGTDTGTDTGVDTPSTSTDKGYYFSSVSGNIRCLVTEDLLMCRQGEIKYSRPSANCSPLTGTTIGLTQAGVTWPCLTTDYDRGEPVAYDTTINKRGYTCLINKQAGIRCTNKNGNGFTMEYYAGVRTF